MAFRSNLARSFSAKCATVVALLCFLLPVAALAGSYQPPSNTCLTGLVCISNSGGTATGTASGGLFMDGTHGSTASSVFDINGMAVTGTLTLTTGAFSGTNLANSGTFAPGTLTITTTGFNNFSGVLFTGTFGSSSSPIQWIALGKVGAFFEYELIGSVDGTFEGSTAVTGETAQLYFHSTTPYHGGAISLGSGTTDIVVPEQGTIALMGTGLLGLGLTVRRKANRDKDLA